MNTIKSICLRLFLTHLLLAFCNFVSVDADCKVYSNMLMCEGAISKPTEDVSGVRHLIISGYTGDLRNDFFQQLDVSIVNIKSSKITSIDDGFFAALGKKVQILKMNNNDFTTSINNAMNGLEKTLTDLAIWKQSLTDASFLSNMNVLTKLMLKGNGLTQLPDNVDKIFSKLTKLHLQNNRLTALPWNALAKSISPTFKDIKLAGNAWSCDCTMRPLFNLETKWKKLIDDLECATPANVKGRKFTELTFRDVCDEPTTGASVTTKSPAKTPGGGGSSNVGGNEGNADAVGNKDKTQNGASSSTNEQSSATKGTGGSGEDIQTGLATAGLSPAIIAAIIAVVIVLVLVILAVVCFQVRVKRHRGQGGGPKGSGPKGSGSNHMSTKYCTMIEGAPNQMPSSQGSHRSQPGGYGPGYQPRKAPAYQPLPSDDRL